MMRTRPVATLCTIVLAALTGCAAHAQEPSHTQPTSEEAPVETRNKHPEPERTWSPGPALQPPQALLAWLEADAGKTRVRLPVVVEFANAYRHAIARTWIGTSATPPGDDAILITLDDLALGIPVVERARQACPEEHDMMCVVWLDGFWGEGFVSPGEEPAGKPFAVRHVHGRVEPGEASTILVEQ